jgi:meso-butanediol dehydrogenase/(S,S)-butanediol dehydrogenase/diacetyl reductase
MKKVVFITGASRGIGLATVKKFVTNGWKVAAFYNKTEGPKLENVNWYQLEISEHRSIKESFGKAFKDLGRIDSFVNSAGISGYKNLLEYDEELMDKVIGVNEKGMYLSTKEVLSKMSDWMLMVGMF